MMNLDLSGVKPITKKNTRVGGTTKKATFSNFRFSLNSNGDEKFTTGKKTWDALSLDSNGFAIAETGGKVVLMLVPQDHSLAVYYNSPKGEQKSNPFYSSVLKDILVNNGIIVKKDANDVKANDGKPVHQYFKAEKVEATGLPEGVIAAYVLVVDDRSDIEADSDEAQEADNAEPSQSTSTDVEASTSQETSFDGDADDDWN